MECVERSKLRDPIKKSFKILILNIYTYLK